jgi:hypothetical protein
MKKLIDRIIKKKIILFVELDKAKFRIQKEGSCQIFMTTGKDMPQEEKEKAQKLIEEAIELTRKYIDI